MDKSLGIHPRFDNPPVIETVLSIEFEPLTRWTIPFHGLYWATVQGRYPKSSVHGVLVSQIENLSDEPAVAKEVTLNWSPIPTDVRCWFFNAEETELVQVQRDRFIFNWKRGLIEQPYPHYETIRPLLAREWEHFGNFVSSNDIGKIQVKQCEITYINLIELGIGWKNYDQLGLVLAPWSGKTSGSFLKTPEDVEITARYRLPDGRGRLYIRAQPAIRNDTRKEVIQLTLTIRGRPSSTEPASIFDWFDIAQPWLAASFIDITTEHMHFIWGKRTKA